MRRRHRRCCASRAAPSSADHLRRAARHAPPLRRRSDAGAGRPWRRRHRRRAGGAEDAGERHRRRVADLRSGRSGRRLPEDGGDSRARSTTSACARPASGRWTAPWSACRTGRLPTPPSKRISVRDKFWFHPVVALRYDTTSEQLHAVIEGMRHLLEQQTFVDLGLGAGQIFRLGAFSLDVEVFIYLYSRDWNHFLEIQERAALRHYRDRRTGRHLYRLPVADDVCRRCAWRAGGDASHRTIPVAGGNAGAIAPCPLERSVSLMRYSTMVPTVLLVVSALSAPAHAQRRGAPETFTANLQAPGPRAAPAPRRSMIDIQKYSADADRAAVESALKPGGYPAFLAALKKAPAVGRSVSAIRSGTSDGRVSWSPPRAGRSSSSPTSPCSSSAAVRSTPSRAGLRCRGDPDVDRRRRPRQGHDGGGCQGQGGRRERRRDQRLRREANQAGVDRAEVLTRLDPRALSGAGVERAAQREVQVHALDALLGLHADDRRLRRVAAPAGAG